MRGRLFFALGLLVIILGSGIAGPFAHAAGESKFSKAPDFTLKSISGKPVTLSKLKYKVAILNFWATWCPPCRAEIPDFIDLYKTYHKQGLEIIGISVDQSAEPVREFVTEFGVNYPIVMATSAVINTYGNIKGIPTSFILDGKGQIIATYVGFRPREVFEKDIRTVLKLK